MNFLHIIVFGIGAIIYGLIVPAKWRGWVLLAASVVAIYWLQPAIPVRPMDFVLPNRDTGVGGGGVADDENPHPLTPSPQAARGKRSPPSPQGERQMQTRGLRPCLP